MFYFGHCFGDIFITNILIHGFSRSYSLYGHKQRVNAVEHRKKYILKEDRAFILPEIGLYNGSDKISDPVYLFEENIVLLNIHTSPSKMLSKLFNSHGINKFSVKRKELLIVF